MSATRQDVPAPLPSGEEATLVASPWEAQLTAAWDVRGIDIATMQFKRGTAVAPPAGLPESHRVGTLPTLLAPGPEGAKPQFEIGDVLGEGGMGVVRVAQQLALRREVAVKTLRPEAGQTEAPQLLREGWVTGVLEHPNVVPVYALGRDNDDRPLLVMKRISGDSWGWILSEAKEGERLTDAYLRKHLAILKQVAVAVHYAHDKGIIHRDLKPDNVMVGGFGEVYVVDWGIAVSLRDDAPGVPCVRDITAIEGTPGYMAPEMAAADGSVIDARSDVYLLGAILHEILTGHVPHSGRTITAVLTAAFASEPHPYPDEVPRDLVEICHTAMARFSEDRYPSAAAFADALDEFIVHRSSTLLSDEAALRLRETRDMLESSTDDGRESERLYAKFSECRFAFTQALRSWPENEPAIEGLQETLELMIEHELNRDAPRAALSLVLSLPRKRPDLDARVRQAIEAKKRQQARLAELERDTDIRVGAGTRKAIGMMLAASWGVACITSGLLTRAGVVVVSHNAFAVVALGFAGATTISALLRRESVLTTAVNRRLAVFTTLLFTGYAGLWLYAGLAGIPHHQTCVLQSLIGVVIWSAAGLTTSRLWSLIAAGAGLGVVLVIAFPALHFEMVGLTGGLSSMLVAYLTPSGRKAA